VKTGQLSLIEPHRVLAPANGRSLLCTTGTVRNLWFPIIAVSPVAAVGVTVHRCALADVVQSLGGPGSALLEEAANGRQS
jgi:hypothetical protein